MGNNKTLGILFLIVLFLLLNIATYLYKSGNLSFIAKAQSKPTPPLTLTPAPHPLSESDRKQIGQEIKASRNAGQSPYDKLVVEEFKKKLPIQTNTIGIEYSSELNQFLITLKNSAATHDLSPLLKQNNMLSLYTSGSSLFLVGRGDAASTLAFAHKEMDNKIAAIYDRSNVAGVAVANAASTNSTVDPDEPVVPDSTDLQPAVDMVQQMMKFGASDPSIEQKVEPPPTIPNSGTIPIETNGVPTTPIGSDQTTVVQGIRVWTGIAAKVDALLNAAHAAGLDMSGTGWRDPQAQIALRRANCGTTDYDIYQKPSGECSPPTARPGTSNHEKGLAIDFTCSGATMRVGDACYQWMTAHAATFGFYNLPSESWHWSIDGH